MGEKSLTQVARDMNEIAGFVAVRDVKALVPGELERVLGKSQADVAVLFGGAILAGADELAAGMRAGIARTYALVGGAGHTTPAFRASVRGLCPDVEFADGASEAEVFDAYLRTRHGLAADLLETASTNCGANVVNLRALLAERGVSCRSMVIVHDATMQRRMSAQIEKEMPGVRRVNYASPYPKVVARVGEAGEELAYDRDLLGMWDMGHYLSLLMGEVARLTDDEHGYGPCGTGFIAHVEVPASVCVAWERLRAAYPGSVRVANPTFASVNA